MKLLKKLLPFATVASVATIGLSTATACNSSPEKEKQFTVTFNLDGGKIEGLEDKKMSVLEGTTFGMLPRPIKENFVFDHWTVDGKKVEFTKKISKDVELVANYASQPGPIVYEYSDIGLDSNIQITSTDHSFQLNKAIVIEYSLTDTYNIDRLASEIQIGSTTYSLSDEGIAVDEISKVITINASIVIDEAITVDLKTIQYQPEETYVWDINNGEPVDWDPVDPIGKDQPCDDWVVTEEYLSAVEENKKILAGDMASSYYSTIAPYDTTYLDNVTTTIKDINPSAWKMSYTIVENPVSGHEADYYRIDVDNFAYVIAWTVVTIDDEEVYTGWATEPLAFWLATTSITQVVKYLQVDKMWNVAITEGAEGSRTTRTYNHNTPSDPYQPYDENSLEWFIQNEVREFNLSFKTDYWAYDGPT